MDIRTALTLRDKAQQDLDLANEAIARITTESSIQSLVDEIAAIDLEIDSLQQARDVLDTKLIKERIKRGEQSLVTVREASMITEMGEMTIRAYANPARSGRLELVKAPGDLVKVTVESLKRYIKD